MGTSLSFISPRSPRVPATPAATHSPHAAATTAPEPAPVATASQSLRQGEHPPGRSETAASDDTGPSWESGRPNGAHIAVASPVQDDGPDGRPPSIYLNEQLDVDVEADTTTCDSGIIAPYSSPDPTPTPASASSSMPRPASATVNVSVLSAPRARRMTLDLPSSPIDVLYASDHKLALEGTSPKPCIVPGNALHLIDDDPAAPRSMTPPSIIIVGDESEHGLEPDLDGADDHHDHDHHGGEAGEGEPGGGYHRSGSEPPHECARPVPRVRFRSRVRITSGVHRHRHSHSHSHSATTGGGTSTPGSSTEDSPSSSISAPLRYQADDNTAWGPIGKRLSGYAGAGRCGDRRSGTGRARSGMGAR
ncbi:hypothetical protein C8Q80DRAFT_109396 [Daedaleopsis nitida]|nr:hypothetical protein C8Q80DRAFT_109396 [Daedaleopsis nitida]